VNYQYALYSVGEYADIIISFGHPRWIISTELMGKAENQENQFKKFYSILILSLFTKEKS